MPIVLSHPVCGTLLQQPLGTNTESRALSSNVLVGLNSSHEIVSEIGQYYFANGNQ